MWVLDRLYFKKRLMNRWRRIGRVTNTEGAGTLMQPRDSGLEILQDQLMLKICLKHARIRMERENVPILELFHSKIWTSSTTTHSRNVPVLKKLKSQSEEPISCSMLFQQQDLLSGQGITTIFSVHREWWVHTLLIWSRNSETLGLQYGHLELPSGCRPKPSPIEDPICYFKVNLRNRKNWQKRMKNGEQQLNGEIYNNLFIN